MRELIQPSCAHIIDKRTVAGVDRVVIFSTDHRYRYFLGVTWNPELPVAASIGMNPSTADAFKNDNTITKELTLAATWGCGSLWKFNLFGIRTPYPRLMKQEFDPVGSGHDASWIAENCVGCKPVVATWGDYQKFVKKQFRYRWIEVCEALERHGVMLGCLRQSEKTGMPWHPLYLPLTVKPILFERRDR